LAEGCVNGNTIVISQTKPDTTRLIESLMKEAPQSISVNVSKYDRKTIFAINDPRIAAYLAPLGNCYSKYIPQELKTLSSQLLDELVY